MPYAVELDLDPAAAARIDAICTRLESRHGFETIRSLGAHAHISLALYERADPVRMTERLADFAARQPILPLPLAAIGGFPGDPAYAFLAPVVTADLLALHAAFHEAFQGNGAECSPHYRPGTWVPHVTVGTDLAASDLPQALAVCAENWVPIAARLVALRFIRYRPVTTLGCWPLAMVE